MSVFSPNTKTFLNESQRVDLTNTTSNLFKNHRCILCMDGEKLCMFKNVHQPVETVSPKFEGCFSFKLFSRKKKDKTVKKLTYD
jgi:hypothetical protein